MAWTYVYENDVNGQRVGGDLATLIRAIENGAEVRVLTTDGPYQAIRTAQIAYVLNGVVYAQNNTNVATDIEAPAGGKQVMFQDNSYYYFEMISTSGYRDAIRWLVGQHTPMGHTQDRVAAKWFVS